MKADGQPVTQSERLTLRRLTEGDAEFYCRLVNEPSWIRNIGDRGIRTPEDAANFIRTKTLPGYEALGFGLYAVERRTDGVPMGLAGLVRRDTRAIFVERAKSRLCFKTVVFCGTRHPGDAFGFIFLHAATIEFCERDFVLRGHLALFCGGQEPAIRRHSVLWNANAHLVSGRCELSMTVLVVTVNEPRQSLHWIKPSRCDSPSSRWTFLDSQCGQAHEPLGQRCASK